MKYKFITIEQCGELYGGPYYAIFNRKSHDLIGNITWYPAWKQFVFSSDDRMVFNKLCLLNIVDFIDNHAKPPSR